MITRLTGTRWKGRIDVKTCNLQPSRYSIRFRHSGSAGACLAIANVVIIQWRFLSHPHMQIGFLEAVPVCGPFEGMFAPQKYVSGMIVMKTESCCDSLLQPCFLLNQQTATSCSLFSSWSQEKRKQRMCWQLVQSKHKLGWHVCKYGAKCGRAADIKY